MSMPGSLTVNVNCNDCFKGVFCCIPKRSIPEDQRIMIYDQKTGKYISLSNREFKRAFSGRRNRRETCKVTREKLVETLSGGCCETKKTIESEGHQTLVVNTRPLKKPEFEAFLRTANRVVERKNHTTLV